MIKLTKSSLTPLLAGMEKIQTKNNVVNIRSYQHKRDMAQEKFGLTLKQFLHLRKTIDRLLA